jgi:hypothetical protein
MRDAMMWQWFFDFMSIFFMIIMGLCPVVTIGCIVVFFVRLWREKNNYGAGGNTDHATNEQPFPSKNDEAYIEFVNISAKGDDRIGRKNDNAANAGKKHCKKKHIFYGGVKNLVHGVKNSRRNILMRAHMGILTTERH